MIRQAAGLGLAVPGGALLGVFSHTAAAGVSCGDYGEPVCRGDVLLFPAGLVLLIMGVIVAASALATIVALGIGGATTLILAGTGPPGLGGIQLVFTAMFLIPACVIAAVLVTARRRGIGRAMFIRQAVSTLGTVTAVADTGITVNKNPRVRLTIGYTRADGTDAELTMSRTVPRLSIPVRGAMATVWYDQASGTAIAELGPPAGYEAL